MADLLENTNVRDWLEQFPTEHRDLAERLIGEVLLVGADEIKRGLRDLINRLVAEDGDRLPMALYAEREVEDDTNGILPMFGKRGDSRATGTGPNPVVFDPNEPEVGSEGLIANFITGLERYNPNRFIPYPGPDILRGDHVRRIVIVTDFIGSGSRIWDMLEAFRKVRSLRSWKSSRHLDFCIVAYSGTEKGLDKVRSNGLKPRVLTYVGCPTIDQTFRGKERTAVYNLCFNFPKNEYYYLGYGHTGALIAFEHGIPDNTPALFHSESNGWKPLFPNRSANAIVDDFPSSNADEIAKRAKVMLNIRNTEKYLSSDLGRRWIKVMLVLTAIKNGSYKPGAISSATRLKNDEVTKILQMTQMVRWTTSMNKLTVMGQEELKRLRRRRASKPVLPSDDNLYYFPTQLRAR